MAEVKVEGAELKKLVKLSKKKPLAFAFSPGKKPDEHIFAIDRRKSPEFLGKNAKSESTGMKVAFGTCELKGKLLTMTCTKVVPTMAKTVKKYLKSQKIMLNVEILDAAGNSLESDIEELPDDPTMEDDDELLAEDDAEDAVGDAPEAVEAEAEEKEAAAQDAKALAARLKAVQPAIAAAAPEAAAKLQKVLAMAVGLIKSGDLDKADQTITALEGAVAKLGGAPAAPGAPEAAEAPATGPAPVGDTAALAARAKSLKQVIDGIDGPAKDKLLAALGTAAKMIKAADLTNADAALTKIEAAANKVAGGAPAPGSDDAAAKWAAEEARLQPLVDKAMAEKRGDLDAINRAFNYGRELAADGAYDRALASGATVDKLLKEAAGATTSAAAAEAEASIPHDVVPYVQSRLAWISTRSDLRKELEGLKSAIDSATADVEGMEDVPSKSGVLFDYLSDIDSTLEDTLEKLVEAPDGDAREGLKTEARKIIDTYRGVLDEPFFQAVDDNGFVKTNIRGAALDSLAKVSQALAA